MKKNNSVMRRTHHLVPVYNIDMHIALTEEDVDVLRERFKIPQREWVAGTCSDCRNMDTGEARVIIYVKPRDDKASWMVSASHEALHAAYYILDICGVRHDVTNHEALCYLHDHIFGILIARYAELVNS